MNRHFASHSGRIVDLEPQGITLDDGTGLSRCFACRASVTADLRVGDDITLTAEHFGATLLPRVLAVVRHRAGAGTGEMTTQALGHNRARRGIVNWLLGTSAVAFLVSVVYPVARYLVPPETGESTAASVTLPIKPDDVKPNSGQIFKFGSRPGILIRTPAGELRAFSAVCTHLNCTVQYRPDLSHIWCACHNGHYDLSGKNIAGPPPRPLEAYVANARGGQIVVAKA